MSFIIFIYKGGIIVLKLLAKISEKYARNTNTACAIMWLLHQPKMPASLIKKDNCCLKYFSFFDVCKTILLFLEII